MLTIRAAKNPGYYETPEFARDDYYTERDSVPGRWIGRGAQTLRLGERPARGDLETLLSGRSPRTGESITQSRGRKPTNAGFDLTFTAPKSVSILLAVGDERVQAAVLAAHDAGVRAGFDYLERQDCFARRGTDGVEAIRAEGFAGAAYTHEMSRSGDPHLHTHVVITNRVRAASDKRWTAPDMRSVYAAAKTAGTIAEATERDELTRSLGVRWGRVVNGTAEMTGIPPAVREHFSQRHKEIADLALVRGWVTEQGIAAIQRETRDRKPHIDRDVAQEQWRARAAEHGFGTREIGTVLGKPPPARPPSSTRALRRHLASRNGLTQHDATFTERDVIQGISAAYPEGIAVGELLSLTRTLIAHDSVLVAAASGARPALYTTDEMIRTELQLIETATKIVPKVPTVSERNIERAIARVAREMKREGKTLGLDQADAARYLTSGSARTTALEAYAGYGKTTTLRIVREGCKLQGIPVVGTSWQGIAAQTLDKEAGIPSTTAASLLGSIRRSRSPVGKTLAKAVQGKAATQYQAIPDGAVLVVDEATMVPTRAFNELVQEVARRNGRVILVGDRGQITSIDEGGAFAGIVDRAGVTHLIENRRQADDIQHQAAEHLRQGRAADALALLTQHDRFRGYDDVVEARADLIDAWAETSLHSPQTALILAHDNRDVDALNGLARERLDRAGLLGEHRITAYGREWATGDRLVCRKNDYREGVRLMNGTRATVTKVHRARHSLAATPVGYTVTIRTDDGRTVRLPPDYLKHVEYGYAVTGHRSQAATTDRTYLLASPGRGGAEWAYVAASRHRTDLRVYAVHHDPAKVHDALQKTWQSVEAKRLAMDRMSPEELDRACERLGLDLPRHVRTRAPSVRAPTMPAEPARGARRPHSPTRPPPDRTAPSAPGTSPERPAEEDRVRRRDERKDRRRRRDPLPKPRDHATEADLERARAERRQRRREQRRRRDGRDGR